MGLFRPASGNQPSEHWPVGLLGDDGVKGTSIYGVGQFWTPLLLWVHGTQPGAKSRGDLQVRRCPGPPKVQVCVAYTGQVLQIRTLFLISVLPPDRYC